MLEVEFKKISYSDPSPKGKRALEHRLCYDLLYKMLKEYFDLDEPEILKTDKGKPYINVPGVHFSISHTNGLVACAISDKPIGIDAEKMLNRDKRHEEIAKRFFTDKEFAAFEESQDKTLAFYKAWCGKEATIKKLGETMALLRKIDTTMEIFEYIFEDDYIICIKI